MGLINKIADAGKGVSRGVSEKSKNASESSNLRKKILYEEERITEIMQEIGKQFYQDPNGDHSGLMKYCEDIDQRKRRIQNMKHDLTSMRGYRTCPNCNAMFDDKYTFEFCGKCGAPLPK